MNARMTDRTVFNGCEILVKKLDNAILAYPIPTMNGWGTRESCDSNIGPYYYNRIHWARERIITN
ncbi:MAG: hypothetical protein KAR42_12085 [candidate division Zixibacteria bacterium]|nr:hypothetical protein [candidate division Zixibacteria bacterium]